MKKVTLICVGTSKDKELELRASWVYSQPPHPQNLVWSVTGVGKAERWAVEIWGAGEQADKTEASILIS